MAALTTARDPGQVLDLFTLNPVEMAATAVVYQGGIVCLDSAGRAVAGADGAGRVYGVARETVDNSAGGAGDLDLNYVAQGPHHFANSGTDPVTDADLMRPVFVEDDQTIARTQNATGTLPTAGILLGVDATEGCLVWVGTMGAVVGNNLMAIQAQIPDVSTISSTYYTTSPVNGRIVHIVGTLQGAITVAAATVTTNIGGTPVTGGALTIAVGAAGTGDSAEPTAANVLAVGDAITVVSDGGSTDAAVLDVILLVQVD